MRIINISHFTFHISKELTVASIIIVVRIFIRVLLPLLLLPVVVILLCVFYVGDLTAAAEGGAVSAPKLHRCRSTTIVGSSGCECVGGGSSSLRVHA